MNETSEAVKPTETAVPPVRLSIAREVLGEALYGLVRLNPTSSQVRAMVAAKCGHMPPDSANTAETIVDWVEFNIRNPQPLTPLRNVNAQLSPAAFSVDVSLSEIELGTCNYSCHNGSSEEISITSAEMLECAETCDTMRELNDAITQLIEEKASDIGMDDSSDYDYDNHESSERSDYNCDYSSAFVRSAIREALAELAPEQLERLEG